MVDVNTTAVHEAVIVPFAVFLDYQARRHAAAAAARERALQQAIGVDPVDIEGVRV
jgi:hypothetical protein